MTIYVELFILDNLLINYYILYLSGRFLRIPMRVPLGLLAALTGAMYGLMQFAGMVILNTLPLKIALSLLMVLTAYYPFRTKLWKLAGMFYAVSFLFGGAAMTVYFLTGQGGLIGGAFALPVPLRYAMAMLMIGTLLERYLKKVIRAARYNTFGVKVTVTLDDVSQTMTCFVDSGNRAMAYALPVIFIWRERGEKFAEILGMSHRSGDVPHKDKRVRIVPLFSAGGNGQLVEGFMPDRVTVESGGKVRTVKAIIAFLDHDFDGMETLIHPELLPEDIVLPVAASEHR